MNTEAEMQKLVLMHMRLAYKVAWEYHGSGIEQEELQSVALYGLVKTVSGYDRSREVPFPAFASAMMHNIVRMEFRKAKKDRKCVSMDERITGSMEDGNRCVWQTGLPAGRTVSIMWRKRIFTNDAGKKIAVLGFLNTLFEFNGTAEKFNEKLQRMPDTVGCDKMTVHYMFR